MAKQDVLTEFEEKQYEEHIEAEKEYYTKLYEERVEHVVDHYLNHLGSAYAVKKKTSESGPVEEPELGPSPTDKS